jgi:hypothetical protein
MPTIEHMSVLKWEIVDDVLVIIGASGTPSMEEWDGYVEALTVPSVRKQLSLTLGLFSVNSAMRKRSVAVLKERQIPVATLTDSGMVRGLVTVVAWMGADIRGFAPSDLERAFDYLQVDVGKRSALTERLSALKQAFLQSRP